MKMMIAATGTRSPKIVNAQVSPGLRSYTSPHTEQRSRWRAQPWNMAPRPQCGHRLRMPRETAVNTNCRLALTLTAGRLCRRLPRSAAHPCACDRPLARCTGRGPRRGRAAHERTGARAEPVAWAQIGTAALKGRPARLAWSDDRSELYLQVVRGTTSEDLSFRHYLIKKGGPPRSLDTQPKWVEEYW